MVKYCTPVLIVVLFAARMSEDVEAGFKYNDYPLVFNLIFGWVIALGLPVSLIFIGLSKPMTIDAAERARRESSIAGEPLAPELSGPLGAARWDAGNDGGPLGA